MRNPTKPCMMTCPAIVPTAELDSPEASSDTRNTPAAPEPKDRYQGASRRCSISATSSCTPSWKTEAAIATIAILTSPARPSASTTSRFENRSSRRRSPSVRGDDTILSEAGMQIDRVRHDRGADDADSEQHRLAAIEPRHDRVERRLPTNRAGR